MTGKSGGNFGRSRGGKARVRTAKGRTTSSVRWLERQLNDPYVTAAKAAGYRSRAAFKLKELDEKFGIFKNVRSAVDLGAAPGGWCQVALQINPKMKIAAIDLLEMASMAGVHILRGDFLEVAMVEQLQEIMAGPVDLVLSDMAANTVGHKQTDHIRTMALCEAAVDFAEITLKPGGTFVAKVFAGGAEGALLSRMKKLFTTVKHAKPPASRKDSSEWYVVAQGFKARVVVDLSESE
jgi:23S rRNA (uridine2552-2'-O)-methyltransferase